MSGSGKPEPVELETQPVKRREKTAMNIFTKIIDLSSYRKEKEAEEAKVQNRLKEIHELAEMLREEAQRYDSGALLAMLVDLAENQKLSRQSQDAYTKFLVEHQKYQDKSAEYTKSGNRLTVDQWQELENIRKEMDRHRKENKKWSTKLSIRRDASEKYIKEIYETREG